MAEKLTSGDTFPELSLKIASGASLQLPTDIKYPFTVVLFYRGHW